MFKSCDKGYLCFCCNGVLFGFVCGPLGAWFAVVLSVRLCGLVVVVVVCA